MPAHPGFSEENLDQLLAYLRAMGERKQDGDAAPKAP
jgi:cytochrome c1